jgi:hypothetical protein
MNMRTQMSKQINIQKKCALPLISIMLMLWPACSGIAPASTLKTNQMNSLSKPVSKTTDDAVCLHCHGSDKFTSDPSTNIAYIEKDIIKKSLHKNIACVECHTDLADFAKMSASLGNKIKMSNSRWVLSLFVVTPEGIRHKATGPNLYSTANISCLNCKEHSRQKADYSASVHNFLNNTGKTQKTPTCSTCHGSHYITRSLNKDEAFRAATRSDSKKQCGGCHKKSFESYDDVYHGRPYKAGSPHAPACWDCHGSHLVKSIQDPKSMVSKVNMAGTCEKCHKESVGRFISYSPMIHGRQGLLDKNPVVEYKNKVVRWIDKNITNRIEQAYIIPMQSFFTTKYKEYLTERDKAVTIPTRDD